MSGMSPRNDFRASKGREITTVNNEFTQVTVPLRFKRRQFFAIYAGQTLTPAACCLSTLGQQYSMGR